MTGTPIKGALAGLGIQFGEPRIAVFSTSIAVAIGEGMMPNFLGDNTTGGTGSIFGSVIAEPGGTNEGCTPFFAASEAILANDTGRFFVWGNQIQVSMDAATTIGTHLITTPDSALLFRANAWATGTTDRVVGFPQETIGGAALCISYFDGWNGIAAN